MTPDTKTRILDVAEAKFSDLGFAGASLRDITTEAGVNLAAVNYHFGSKEALLAAVFERRIVPVNEERLRLLEAAEAAPDHSSVERIVRAFIEPAFRTAVESGARDAKFMRLVGRMHVETNEQISKTFLGLFVGILTRFEGALRRALPHLEPHEVTWRLRFLVGALAHTCVWTHKITPLLGEDSPSGDELLDALVQFGVSGISAPMPVAARRGRS